MAANIDLEEALLGPLVAGRTCAGCAVCCDVLKIDTPELRKPAGALCVHRSAGGCAIHAGSRKVLVHPEADVAHHVISGDPAPAYLEEEVAAWRARYGMFG